jgi:hypothetical protein
MFPALEDDARLRATLRQTSWTRAVGCSESSARTAEVAVGEGAQLLRDALEEHRCC